MLKLLKISFLFIRKMKNDKQLSVLTESKSNKNKVWGFEEMGEIKSCPKCNTLFNYNGIREICSKCAASEEEMYETVYRFLRRRENRAATIERIVEVTGVEEDLLHKWVRKGRLQPALFPNLGYPCDNCGRLTSEGKLCKNCQTDLKNDLNKFEAAKVFRKSIKNDKKGTYLSDKEG